MIRLDSQKNLKEFEAALISVEAGWYRVSYSRRGLTEKERLENSQRGEDLKWLKSALQKYEKEIHKTSQSQRFWYGCSQGKSYRRTLNSESRKALNLVKKAFGEREDTPEDLGLQVGWRYARLKSYVSRHLEQLSKEHEQDMVTFG